MLDRDLIRNVFRSRLLDMEGVPDEEKGIAWENREFTPPGISPPYLWIRERMVWGGEVLKAADRLEMSGQVIYDLFWPSGEETEEPDRFSVRMGNWFAPQIFSQLILPRPDRNPQNITVSILRTEALQGMRGQVGNSVWYQIPFRISFQAHGDSVVL